MSLASDHTDAINNIAVLAIADLVGLFALINPLDAPSATAGILTMVPSITDTYGAVAASVGADYYDEARAVAVAGRFTSTPADVAVREQVDAVTRWAVGPLWSGTPNPSAALDQLSAGVERLVRQPDRDTIHQAVKTDPKALGYARVPSPNACPFCTMLASRGAVYKRDAAIFTKQGTRYHERCRCSSVAVFGPDDIPDVNRHIADAWNEATRGVTGPAAQMRAWTDTQADHVHA